VTTKIDKDDASRSTTGQKTHFSRRLSSTLLEDGRNEGSGGEVVAMVQATDSQHGHDPASRIGALQCFTVCRSSLLQREMRPVVVVVTDVLGH
jgi:hypothetical protein